MSHKDVVRSEQIGNQLTVGWRPDSADPVLRVERVWRPTFPLRSFLYQGFAILFAWVATSAPLVPASYLAATLARVVLGAMAMMFSYLGFAEIINRTIVTLGRAGLSVRHKPLPWPGNREVPLATLTVARMVQIGGQQPHHAVQILAGSESHMAIHGIDSEPHAQRVADILNESIGRLQKAGGA